MDVQRMQLFPCRSTFHSTSAHLRRFRQDVPQESQERLAKEAFMELHEEATDKSEQVKKSKSDRQRNPLGSDIGPTCNTCIGRQESCVISSRGHSHSLKTPLHE